MTRPRKGWPVHHPGQRMRFASLLPVHLVSGGAQPYPPTLPAAEVIVLLWPSNDRSASLLASCRIPRLLGAGPLDAKSFPRPCWGFASHADKTNCYCSYHRSGTFVLPGSNCKKVITCAHGQAAKITTCKPG
jgi:hypothetical protein